MPDFIYDHKVYYNPVEFALNFIGGTWKMPILWRLNKATMRYGELKKTLPHITHKMLSSQLKELEKHELISRKAYAAVPPKVEYTITDKGKKVIPVIEVIRNYGLSMIKENGLEKVEQSDKKVLAKKKKKSSK
jgi:DNA-binding HxlR family transcriptional regulator